MGQLEYDYEEEDSNIGGEEKAVPRNASTPYVNSFMTSIPEINPIIINSLQTNQDCLGLIDSGADTSMIEPEFFIEVQHDHRKVSIEGFGGPSHTIRNMKIGNGITALDFEKEQY